MSNYNDLIAAQVGSRLYGLETDSSDYDYALFGIDVVNDGAPYAFQHTSSLVQGVERLDGVYRRMDKLLWMADYSCIYHLAYLFSDNVSVAPVAEGFWQNLQVMREQIATANLPRFRELCFARLERTIRGASEMPYGDNNKALMHSLFYCDLIRKFATEAPYADCIKQDTKTLLAVRRGEIPEAQARAMLNDAFSGLNCTEVVQFYKRPKSRKLFQELNDVIRVFCNNAE